MIVGVELLAVVGTLAGVWLGATMQSRASRRDAYRTQRSETYVLLAEYLATLQSRLAADETLLPRAALRSIPAESAAMVSARVRLFAGASVVEALDVVAHADALQDDSLAYFAQELDEPPNSPDVVMNVRINMYDAISGVFTAMERDIRSGAGIRRRPFGRDTPLPP